MSVFEATAETKPNSPSPASLPSAPNLSQCAPSPTTAGASEKFVMMRIRYELSRDAWASQFTRKHPEVRVDVHNVTPMNGKYLLGEFTIQGTDGHAEGFDWAKELAELPDVLQVQRLEGVQGTQTYRILSHLPVTVALGTEYGLLMRYPRTVKNGFVTCETIAHVHQIRGFIAATRAAGRAASVVSLRRDALRSSDPALTPTQRTMFYEAVAAGYFEVPRRITLTELARKLSKSKSAVSEGLAVVERKLAEEAVRRGL